MPMLTAPVQLSPHLYIVYFEFPHLHSGNVFLVAGLCPTLIDCGSERAVPQRLTILAQLGLEGRDFYQVITT